MEAHGWHADPRSRSVLTSCGDRVARSASTGESSRRSSDVDGAAKAGQEAVMAWRRGRDGEPGGTGAGTRRVIPTTRWIWPKRSRSLRRPRPPQHKHAHRPPARGPERWATDQMEPLPVGIVATLAADRGEEPLRRRVCAHHQRDVTEPGQDVGAPALQRLGTAGTRRVAGAHRHAGPAQLLRERAPATNPG